MSKKNRNRYNNTVALATAPTPEQKPQNRNNSPIKYILDQQKLRSRQDLLKLKIAIDSAESVHNYDRQMLHDIYREIDKDPNLTSNWESRKMKVKEKAFKIRKGNAEGEENKELTAMLETPWFYSFIDACLDSKKWDFSMIEFGPLDNGVFLPYKVNNKYYDPITVIDRDNVKPELGLITSIPGDVTGISFDDPQYSKYLMFVGDYRLGTGILWRAAKYILFKDNCLENWSEWAEVFGMDKRVGYTNADGDDRKYFIKALRDMGSNAYGVFMKDDKVEYLGTQRQDAYKVYHEYAKYIDEQIAKLVFGQDVVSNNTGKVVGSVGENIANMYGDNDAKFIKSIVNTRLFPMMAQLGYTGFEGHVFDWDTTEKISLLDRSTIDKNISDMGKEHSDEYINMTYGTDVTKKEEPEMDPVKVAKKVKAMYE
jgi:hypothetical protein